MKQQLTFKTEVNMAVKQSKANITRYPVEYLRVPNDVILNEGPDPDEN